MSHQYKCGRKPVHDRPISDAEIRRIRKRGNEVLAARGQHPFGFNGRLRPQKP